MTTTELLIVVAVLLVVVLAGLGVYAGRGKRRRLRQARRDVAAAGLGPRSTSTPAELQAADALAPGAATSAAAAASVGAVLDRPEAASSRLIRLRARLAGSTNVLGQGLLTVLTRQRLDESTWEDIENLLLQADVGVAPTQELVAKLRADVQVLGTRTPQQVHALVREHLLAMVGPELERQVVSSVSASRPAVVMVVGVNGTGKTTTVAKLARLLVANDQQVVLAAADTFRAAAADQLQTWGDRVGVPTVRGPEGGDPASVAYEAVATGAKDGADVVLIDTAGRLHNKVGLMDELAKVKRVVEKHSPVDEVLLVLDATTGQNGLIQARVFAQAVNVTGIVLTKLDGSARGGIVIAVQRELGVPVKLVGLGEGGDDLAEFDPQQFVDAILGQP